MTDAALLLIVVGGFYVMELFRRGSGGTAFHRTVSGRWTWRAEQRSIVGGNPLPLFCECVSVPAPSISSPDACVAQDGGGDDRARIHEPNARKRQTLARRQLRAELDPEQHRHRFNDWRRAVTTLTTIGTLQFVFVFAYAPALCFRYGFERVWIALFTGAALLNVVAAGWFYRSHLRLHRELGAQRWERALMILVSPANAMRAAAALDAFPSNGTQPHPVAIAALLLGREKFIDCARRTLLDVRAKAVAASEDARSALEWYAAEFEKTLPLALDLHDVTVADLLTPPHRDEQCAAWCRRCHAQYTRTDGECADCTDMPLAAF